MRILLTTCLLLAGIGVSADAAESQKAGRRQFTERMEGARAEVYKRIGETNLMVHIFEPSTGAKTNRAAIVFFFGGGWTSGSPGQFEQQCRHFASRGLVAMAADYRVNSRHGVKPVTCVADAKSEKHRELLNKSHAWQKSVNAQIPPPDSGTGGEPSAPKKKKRK